MRFSMSYASIRPWMLDAVQWLLNDAGELAPVYVGLLPMPSNCGPPARQVRLRV